MANETLQEVVDAVRQSPKYRGVCLELVQRIAAQEIPKYRSLKEAIKATKNKLHQVGGAYQPEAMRYAEWLAILRDPTVDLRAACRKIMASHASTRERLPILEDFYAALWTEMPPVQSILDIACGLNPLAIPWMGEVTAYYAYDIYDELIAFINAFLELMKVKGAAVVRDVGQFHPPEAVDVALVLKTLPCLEQVDKTGSLALLERLKARYLVVSFPVHSLGGRHKGMIDHYEKQFFALIAGKNWDVKRFLFKTELAFLVNKHAGE